MSETHEEGPPADGRTRTEPDEVGIIASVYGLMRQLDADAQARVLDWLESRLKWDNATRVEAAGRG